MNITLKPYPEYKDSGLLWLGKIPVHWSIIRTKHLFRLCTEKAPANNGLELLSIYTHIGVKPRKELEERGNKASSTDEYWMVKRGDIIVNKLLAWMGAIGVSHYEGVTSPAYNILRGILPLNPDFYHYLFRTGIYLREFKSRSRGIMAMRLRLYFDEFGQIPLVYPPLADQTAIVHFLDYYGHLVNQAIRGKRRLIELLNEQKQAIIHHAVTRSLDPNVRLKFSGVDWLGAVPEHWEVKTLKQIAVVRLSGVDKHTAEGETSVRLCNYTDVYNRDQIDSEISFMVATAREAEIAAFSLRAGDVLITKDSETPNDIAVPALVTETLEDVICGYHLALIRPDEKEMSGEYLFHAFCAPSLARQFSVAANGVTRYGLSKHAIKTAIVTVPPIKEQRAICEWIARHLEPIVTSVNRAHREIDLLREYRTRLIAEVVTGKLDVRGVELPVLDETDVVEDWETGEDAEAGEMDEIEGVDA
jgi:type I restriction enzyme S subunit